MGVWGVILQLGGIEMRKLVWLVAIFVFLSARTLAELTPVEVLMHIHQSKYPGLYDDGYATQDEIVAKAKTLGFDAIVFTPHYRKDAHKTKPSEQDGIIVLDGAEVATYWDGGVSHILVIGDFYGDPVIDQLANRWGTQQQLINRFVELGYPVVSAHPNLIAIVNPELTLGKPASFLFNVAEGKGISGREVFNDKEAYDRTLQDILNDVSRGLNQFVTAGCDSHNLKLDPENQDRWTRTTWVWVEGEPTKEKILEAFRLGRVYAAKNGAYIKSINFIPQFEPYNVDKLEFRCTIAFARPVTVGKKINLYFNGASTAFRIDKGEQEALVDFAIDGPPAATITLEVEGCLITSPVRLVLNEKVLGEEHSFVSEEPPETNELPQINELPQTGADLPGTEVEPDDQPITFTGGIPMLLGKTYQEVAEIIGNPDETKMGGFGFIKQWTYRDYLLDEVELHVCFDDLRDNSKKSNQVHWFFWEARHGSEFGTYHPPHLKPADVVPKEVLARTPDIIARSYYETGGEIVVVWFIDGKTFAMQVGDSERLLYEKREVMNDKGMKETYFYLTEAGQDFRKCDKMEAYYTSDYVEDVYSEDLRLWPNCGMVGKGLSGILFYKFSQR